MTTLSPDDAAPALGQRLRQARLQQGLSQEALARPEFSGNYIQAVEQGRASPSAQALAVLARRLRLPLPDLQSLAAPMPSEPDLAALDEDLAYQLDHAKLMILKRQGDAALQLLSAAEQVYRPYMGQFRSATQCRFYRLRGQAYVRTANPGLAWPELWTALALAQQLGDPQEHIRVLKALGAAYRQQGRVREALELHTQCLRTSHAGPHQDPSLYVSIYGNLASDYWALTDLNQAIGLYHETLRLLDDINIPDWQAHVYWGLSLAHQARRELDRARIYAARALDLFEAERNEPALASVSTQLAAILIQQREYGAAEWWLEQAGVLLKDTRWPQFWGPVHEQYTALELAQGRLTPAAYHAYQCLQLSEATYDQPAWPPHGILDMYPIHLRARALRSVGQVEEQQGHPHLADERFRQALALVRQDGYPVIAYEIARAYAELLYARGAYAQATAQYQIAFEARSRNARRPPLVIYYG